MGRPSLELILKATLDILEAHFVVEGHKTVLRLEFMKAENYECQNDPPFVVEGLGPPSENAALAPWSWLAALIVLVATARLQ